MAGLRHTLASLHARTLGARGVARKHAAAAPAQARILRELTHAFAATEFGRAQGIQPAMSYELFRRRVAPRGAEAFHPLLERMRRGAADVLWPGTCTHYIRTAGTSTGRPRTLPWTDALAAHHREAGLDALLFLAERTPGILGGPLHFLSRPTATGTRPGFSTSPLVAYPYADDDFGTLAPAHLPPWLPSSTGAGAPVVSTHPRRLLDFLLERDANAAPLTCAVIGGSPSLPWRSALGETAGRTVIHEVYGSAEALVAVEEGEREHGLRVLCNAGVFFEFLPIADYDEGRLPLLGERALPLEAVQPGVDYALLVTTPGGFCRCPLGDVVRFVTVAPHRLQVRGRIDQRLNALGESTGEPDLLSAITLVCRRRDWSLRHVHVAPVVAHSLTGQQRGHHEWWVELKPGSRETPTGPVLAEALDRELQASAPTYAAARATTRLEAPVVRLVMPGVFSSWLAGSPSRRGTTPTCRGDRLVADALAEIARFSKDQ